MKRMIALLLATVLLVGTMTACNKAPAETQPTETTYVQSAEEQEVLRVLTIGNSHTNDTTWLLYEVFAKEMPEQKVMLGDLYYSGCTVAQHVMYAKGDLPEYVYYKNDSGFWDAINGATLSYALEEQVWDKVFLHEMNNNTVLDQTHGNDNLQTLMDYVTENTAGTPEFLWNLGWANPVAEEYFAEDYAVKAPGGWVGGYQERSDLNYTKMFTQVAEQTQKHTMKNENIVAMAPTGTALCYARNVMGQTDLDLYRDYTHLSDFGRLIAAYVWYATLTGKTEITEVKVDTIPRELRHERFRDFPLVITEEMKNVIIESVNFALKNPWTVSPEK